MSARLKCAGILVAVWFAAAVTGCRDPDVSPSSSSSAVPPSAGVANIGEPRPPSPGAEVSTGAAASPQLAIASFAQLYVNWSYETLRAQQRTLAEIAVGPARLAERQAAASANDEAIARGHIRNSGQIVSIAADRAAPGEWVLVTREQTTGGAQYQGLAPSYHVTLVAVSRQSNGYAVREWLAQS